AAFGSAGERCMAAAVVTVQEEIADEFLTKFTEKVNQQKIGNGVNDDVFLGPVIREEHKQRTLSYIEQGTKEGAKLLRDGRTDQIDEGGYFVGPTIFEDTKKQMKIWQDEIFAPV